MNVWLITVGEPLPTDPGTQRLLRTGIIAELLEKQSHTVTWWTSSVNHAQKKQRTEEDVDYEMTPKYKIKILHTLMYEKNVSIQRIMSQRQLAKKFKRLIKEEPKPDIIISSLPTIDLCEIASRFGSQHNIPVILDVRDLWPDIFLELAPKQIRSLCRLALAPLFRSVNKATSEATAIIGISEPFVDWGLKKAKRNPNRFDRFFPMGYSEKKPNLNQIEKATGFWESFGLRENDFIVCFFGTLGRQFELETVLQAAVDLQSMPIKFVICGDGDNMTYYKNMALDLDNVIFPGWVGANEIWSLLRMSSVGLAPYRSSESFTMSYPNKPIEYLSAGLPVLSSLKGILENMLRVHGCGITYENNNPHQLIYHLSKLYNNQEDLKIMSQNATLLYNETFVAENVYSQLISHLQILINQTKGKDIDQLCNGN